MYVKNRFTPGDCVMPLPIGVPIKVTYNNKGLLHSVVAMTDYTFETESEDTSISLYDTFVKSKIVPLDILIKDGASTVRGILKSNAIIGDVFYQYRNNIGSVPMAYEESLLKDFVSSPYDYTFVATDIQSEASSFTTAVTIKQWLSTAGFNVAKSILVPSGITEIQFIQLIHSNNIEQDCTFPVIAGYTIFNKSSIKHIAMSLDIEVATKKPELTFDDRGNVIIQVTVSGNNDLDQSYTRLRSYPYTKAQKYNIHKGSIIVSDAEDQSVYFVSESKERYDTALSCPLCNAKITIGRDEHHATTCSNPHCPSNTYFETLHMCDSFGLPKPVREDYYKWGRNQQNLVPADYLNTLPETFIIKTSLIKVLRASIPTSILPNDASISDLLHKCNDSQETLIFYVRNSDRMTADLGLNTGMYNRFLKWVKTHDDDIVKMIENPHIQIETSKHLDSVDPTLRTKNIYLTGQFKRGSYSEISEILESYAATIVNQVQLANTVITGALMDGIDGQAVKYARQHDISVVDEDSFFTSYLIDEDLSKLS